MKLDKRKWKRL